MADSPQICCQLTAVVRRMCDAAYENPCAIASDIEKLDLLFLRTTVQASIAVFPDAALRSGISVKKSTSGFACWKVGGFHFYAEHIDHPVVLAHTLMNHLLMDAAATSFGSPRHFAVAKHCPGCQYLQPFGGICVRKKGIPIQVVVSLALRVIVGLRRWRTVSMFFRAPSRSALPINVRFIPANGPRRPSARERFRYMRYECDGSDGEP